MAYSDYARDWSGGFADPASDWLLAIIDLHDQIIYYLLIILAVVVWFLVSLIANAKTLRGQATGHFSHLAHGNLVELIWTVTPALVLWAIGLPSLKLLYLMDEILEPEMTVKIMGSQWYWSYEVAGGNRFDSFSVGVGDLALGHLRQLAVDSTLTLPIHTAIRLLVSSSDVIHSFAVPSLALKVDAIPGRLNLAGLILNRSGNFFGQCSELCGVLHGFMPIAIEGVTLPQYFNHIGSSNSNGSKVVDYH